MKSILTSLLIFITFYSIGQIPQPDKKDIVENHIKEFRMINRKIHKRKSALDNRIMNLKRFNKNGDIEYSYSFNVDIIYTIDSTIYHYDNNGSLTEQINYYIDFPIGKDQMEVVKELGGDVDTNITVFKYRYNSQLQEIQVDEIEFGKLSTRKFTSYDSLGRIVKEEKRYSYLPEDNDYITIYQYNKQGKTETEKTLSLYDSNVKEEKKFEYDEKGNLIKEINSGKWNHTSLDYIYNQEGKIQETIKEGKSIDNGYANNLVITSYKYDTNGNLIEKKILINNELNDWEQYTYNNKNLIKEVFWMNVKTGKVSTSILYEYEYNK